MSFSSNFLNLLIDSDFDLLVKTKYLKEGKNFNYFNSLTNETLDPILTKINSLFSIHSKRQQGFVLLNEYLEECQNLLTLDETILWSTFCLQSTTSKNIIEKQLSLKCLNKIFQIAKDFPEIHRMLSGTVVTKFIDYLNSIKIENFDYETVNEFTNCLQTCLQTFKGPCNSRKKLIQEYILSLNNLFEDENNFLIFAKPFSSLAFTGSNKQLQTNNYFFNHMLLTLYTLDMLTDSNFNEELVKHLNYYSSIKENPFFILENNDKAKKTLEYLSKFKFLILVIQNLLIQNYDNQVQIPVTIILKFIQRIISIKVNQNETTANLEKILNFNIVPTLYEYALSLLNTLIDTCSTNLSVNLKEINFILKEINSYFIDNQNSNYFYKIKISWYITMTNLINKLGIHLTSFVKKIWEQVLFDMFVFDTHLKTMKLELHNAKKTKNERMNMMRLSDNLKINDKDKELCFYSCKLMNTFLITFSKMLDSKKLQKFLNYLLNLVQDIYRVDLYRKTTYFTDINLRIELLKVFKNSLVIYPNMTLLNNSISLFNDIIKLDKSGEIQFLVKETLIVLSFPKNKIYFSNQDKSILEFDQINIKQGLNENQNNFNENQNNFNENQNNSIENQNNSIENQNSSTENQNDFNENLVNNVSFNDQEEKINKNLNENLNSFNEDLILENIEESNKEKIISNINQESLTEKKSENNLVDNEEDNDILKEESEKNYLKEFKINLSNKEESFLIEKNKLPNKNDDEETKTNNQKSILKESIFEKNIEDTPRRITRSKSKNNKEDVSFVEQNSTRKIAKKVFNEAYEPKTKKIKNQDSKIDSIKNTNDENLTQTNESDLEAENVLKDFNDATLI